jgi:hypothetical protein
MPPDLVVRSAGVWNTRAPFAQFVAAHKQISRQYSVAVLAALRVDRDFGDFESEPFSIRGYFVRRQGSRRRYNSRQLAAWRQYRRALGSSQQPRNPESGDVVADVEGAVVLVRRAAIVSHIGNLELFLQCWMLNMLLTRVERGATWSEHERAIACRLSPVHRPVTPPTMGQLVRALPEIERDLRETVFSLSRVAPSPQGPQTEIDLFAALDLWIGVRNLIVHRDGWLSSYFVEQKGPVFNLIFSGLEHIGKLVAMRRLPVFNDMVREVQRVTYMVAGRLNQRLVEESCQRRGHLAAPDTYRLYEPGEELPTPRPLLLMGDHPPSLAWVAENRANPRLPPGRES